jgi:hypothetical protein
MKGIRMRWLLVLSLVGSAAAAVEPDPRAEMARALEAQADVAPSPPRLPQQASLDAKPATTTGEDLGRKGEAVRAAVRAAVKAALDDIVHGAKGALPPPGQAVRDRAEADHGNGPPANPGHKKH